MLTSKISVYSMDLSADSLGVGCLTGDLKDESEYCKVGTSHCISNATP